MKNNKNYTDFEKEFFAKTNIQYSKSKEDVWLNMESNLAGKSKNNLLKVNFKKYIKYSVAAVIVISLGLSSFLRFYSQSIYCPNGQHSAVTLPDGSKVTLNANSKLSYHPYWWKYSRSINFSGEAFFEVKKGKKFEVISERASTTVLGTSFNIFARDNEYKVHCISGKVKVEAQNKEPIILVKNEYGVIKKNSKIIKIADEINNKNSIAWVNNKFIFTSVPLKEIYAEVERQFDIIIEGKEHLNEKVTVTFERKYSLEEILSMIGKPSGIKHAKISRGQYRLTKL